MNKKILAIITLPILAIILSLSIIIINNTLLSPSQQELEQCNTLTYNGEGKINLVFFADKEQTEKYTNHFFQTSPFNTNKNQFNIYYINSYQPECEIYKGIAILCHSRELIKKSASCPNDIIITLKEQPQKIRSSAYTNVISLNTNHPLSVLTHEFGHAFANLAEEYTPAKIPFGSENCQKSCDNFNNLNQDCSQGCSTQNHFRSINQGVMRTLSSNEYGEFNEKLIQDKINKNSNSNPITANAVATSQECTNQQYYLIEGQLQNNQITILSTSIEKGCPGSSGAGDFKINLIDNQEQLISSNEFNPELIFTDTEGQNQIDGETYESDKTFILKTQIIPQAQALQITKQKQTLAEINLNKISSEPCLI